MLGFCLYEIIFSYFNFMYVGGAVVNELDKARNFANISRYVHNAFNSNKASDIILKLVEEIERLKAELADAKKQIYDLQLESRPVKYKGGVDD